MKQRSRLFLYVMVMIIGLLLLPVQTIVGSEDHEEALVYYIPVEQEVERGLEAFLDRSITTAIEDGADHIVLEIDTPGGAVVAAGNIAKIIRGTELPITAYVTKEAISAGAYIALNADKIVMSPGSTMGSAAVIDGGGNAADEKTQSYWLSEMRGSAELNERDPIYAQAMADAEVHLPDYGAERGRLLTLTADQALEVGYAEAVASDRQELLSFLELEGAVEKESEVTFAEQIARFVTNPIIIPILLSVGSLGLVLELYSPGFGVPGIMGLSALGLFFFGHMFAGFAGWEVFILFGVGLLLILIEIFIPGFGIFGILGIGSIIGSMVLASFSTINILISILIAVVITTIGSILVFKFFGARGPFKKIVLTDTTGSEQGYISNVTREELIGKEGITLTPLRPSGSAVFGDERLDVVSEGGYIGQDEKIKIVTTSGARIVVRQVKED
ncbi:NfeD family protein [Desertibacillus haloalkaliphilus]|uniref:NfeD family protein n=1 Tax=Desertibacillus haloalkaliphilus TaxID=1328930 RepID=UPI001C27981A|nr:nodulation protein NfeD [Desertibacillus haloalkaliphilus]MBU8905660.1 nodulation protein NfeD [Desertibacillus haloalkaliphilus]